MFLFQYSEEISRILCLLIKLFYWKSRSHWISSDIRLIRRIHLDTKRRRSPTRISRDGRARRGWPRMDSPWAIPRAKLGWFGNDEKASCVTVSRRRSILPPPPFLFSLSSPPRGHIFSLRRRVPKNLGPRSIHLNIIISFRELGFQGILVFFFSRLFLSFATRRPNRAIRAREFDVSLFPPLRKPPSALPCPRDRSIRPPSPSPASPAPSTFRSTITYGSIGYGR